MTDNHGERFAEDPEQRQYHKIPLPDPSNKPYKDWNVNERRAYIVKNLGEKWSMPSEIPRVDLGNKFDVHYSQISKDVDIIKEAIDENLGHELTSFLEPLLKEAMIELSEEDPYKTLKGANEFTEWLDTVGGIENQSDNNADVAIGIGGGDDAEGVEVNFNLVDEDDAEEFEEDE